MGVSFGIKHDAGFARAFMVNDVQRHATDDVMTKQYDKSADRLVLRQ